MAVKGGGGNFYLKWGKARNEGVGFIMERVENFKVFLYIGQRGANPPIS